MPYIKNRQTGEVVFVPDAQPPADPTFPHQGPKAAADVTNTNATATRTAVQTQGDMIDNRVKSATEAALIAKAKAEAEAAGAAAEKARRDAATAGTGRPQITGAEFSGAIEGYRSAEALSGIIRELEQKFQAGPGATKGIAGVKDWFKSPANESFDKAANAARGTVGKALGFTGGQLNSATEAEMNVGPYIPKAGDFDGTILDSIQRLKELQENARAWSIAVLGGIPDANGRITPIQAPNAMQQPYVAMGAQQAAGHGAKEGVAPIPKPMQSEYNAFLSKNLGRLTPDEYATFRAGLDAKYGFGAPDQTKMEAYRQEAEHFNATAKGGGKINTRIPGPARALSNLEQIRNNAVNNPLGAGAAGYLDSAGFGAVQALAPEQMQALGEDHGIAMTLGQIGGAITGTGLVGKAGAGAFGKIAPGTLGGGGGAQFARNMAADTTYGGIYGGVAQGDPTTGMIAGGLGSAGGQLVGKGLGRAIGGINVAPAMQRLRDAGIPLTTGQTLGGVTKSLEDAATSIPGVGDMINARRLEGLQAFNRNALNEAGSPIGATTQNLGELGVQNLTDQISSSYDNATAGVRVPVDPQLLAELAAARQAGQALPEDLAKRASLAFDNRVDPALSPGGINLPGGELTGEGYQQAVRGLKSYRAEATKPGFEQDYRDVLGQGIDALTGQMTRGGGQHTVDSLRKANEAYKRTKVIQRAVQAAKNGSGSGEIQVFTPSQLNTAATQSANKFGGQRPMAGLIDDAQSVLPSQIPDSGTARRMLTQALPGLGVAGAGVGGLTGGQDGAMTGGASTLAIGALLALGGTKAGQAAINKALTKRPPKMRKAGKAISDKSRAIGAGSIPLLWNTTR